MPRLLLVFWSVVFFRFGAGPGVVLFFITVVTRDPREIFLWPFRPYFVGDCITPGSRGTRAGDFLFALLLSKLFLGLFPSLLGGLCIAGRAIRGLRGLGLWFRLFNSRILYYSALGLYLGCGNVGGTIFS